MIADPLFGFDDLSGVRGSRKYLTQQGIGIQSYGHDQVVELLWR
jgi:hypothetical protein